MAVSFKSAVTPLIVAAALSFGAAGTASADALTENFDGGLPSGWTVVNNSAPQGAINWFTGDTSVFDAYEGAANSYLGSNFNAVANSGTISNWLILPTSTYRNGDTLSFYTRTDTASFFPDNLEVRFSTSGGVDVGNTADSVGTFNTLLLTINPTQAIGGYPESWTQYNVSLSGLTGATNGAFALRYLVTDAGVSGNNGNYIGIDSLNITATAVTAVPELETYLMMAAGLGLVGWMRKRKSRSA
ncbi:hypothetical protein ASF61_01970 [Duganella sp. Leaf126]|uniref:choice-of-anchor J domain-containing protein n=1 Tax=Duganella sp. Leaf126 TaxID=1736266 RepID=UPI0006FF0F04|nr:choice-of-anchor J domain-containing protein [Duganella sp. Leaf126]KQQ47438.1 hypothetical protein ASF61_01970 [Duganella sp. Leaf126]